MKSHHSYVGVSYRALLASEGPSCFWNIHSQLVIQVNKLSLTRGSFTFLVKIIKLCRRDTHLVALVAGVDALACCWSLTLKEGWTVNIIQESWKPF